MADHLSRVDSDICLSRVEVEMAEETGGDVDRQAAVDGLGGEDPAEVMRGEPSGVPSMSAMPAARPAF